MSIQEKTKPNLSTILREKLGITQVKRYRGHIVCSNGELQALRYVLQLSQEQFAEKFGVSYNAVQQWERGKREVQVRNQEPRESLTYAITLAREMNALTYVAPSRLSTKYERPPSNMLYKCTACGRDIRWNLVRVIRTKKGDSKETLEHGRKNNVCGPIVVGGIVHQSQTMQALQWKEIPNAQAT